MTMKCNGAGRAIIRGTEGERLTAYPDCASPRARHKRKTGIDDPTLSGHPWTIGDGATGLDDETGLPIAEGLVWTHDHAVRRFEKDIAERERIVSNVTKGIALNENQFSALVSFVYEVGHILPRMLELMRSGNFRSAADQFDHLIQAQGEVEPGMVKRRALEKALFLTPVETQEVA